MVSTRTRMARFYAVVVQPDGKILIGGDFTRSRLTAARSHAQSHRAAEPGRLARHRLQPERGRFSDRHRAAAGRQDFGRRKFRDTIGGQTRNRIARLDATTGLADSFNPNANCLVGCHRAAGGRQDFGGRLFHNHRRADAQSHCPARSRRPAWRFVQPEREQFSSLQSWCRRMARFWWAAISRSIGGQTRNCIARLDPATGLADSFNPNANALLSYNRGAGGRQNPGGRLFHTTSVGSRAIVSPGSIPRPAWLIRSTRTRTILSVRSPCRRTARFWSADFSARISADSCATSLRGSIPPPDGRLVQPKREQYCLCHRGAGGRQDSGGRRFHHARADRGTAVTRNRIARLEVDGRLDRTLNLGIFGDYCSRHRHSAGRQNSYRRHFYHRSGRTRNHIARLNSDGTLDTAFNPNANGSVLSIAVQADGKILVGGGFTGHRRTDPQSHCPARCHHRPGRLFNPNANNIVNAIAVQADGKILVGGFFRSTASADRPRNHIARLDPTTGLADSFNPNANELSIQSRCRRTARF